MTLIETSTVIVKWLTQVSEVYNLQAINSNLLFAYNGLLIPIVIFSLFFYVLGFYGLKRKDPENRSTKAVKNWPFVTIQIPTYNEIAAIKCAKKCLKFNYPKKMYEIIIGDDSSDNNVSREIDKFAKNHKNIKVTRRGTNEGFKPGNLNHMLKYTKGEYIVIFDSDFLPKADFLRKIVSPMILDKGVAYVQAKWNYINMGKNRISKFASTILMVYHHLLANVNNHFGISLLFGSGEAIRVSSLKKLGGWKNFSVTEDVDFSIRALRAGYKSVYLPNLNVSGEVPFRLSCFSKQQRKWAYGNAMAFKDNARWLLFSKSLKLKQKIPLNMTLLGYASSPFLVMFAILGFLVWFSGTPGPIDIYKFAGATAWSLLINSGFIFAAFVALRKEGILKMWLAVLAASVTVGIVISFQVFYGLLKAFSGRPMTWYMIEKMGNKI